MSAPNNLNWIVTGGMFGKTRRFPGFWVELNEYGNYAATKDGENKVFAQSGSFDGLAKLLKPYCDARERAWLDGQQHATELTPEGEQTVIPGCERNVSPKATQLDLFG